MCVNEYTCRAEMRHVDTRKRAIKAWNTRVFDGKRFTRKQFGEALTRLSNEINIDWGNVGDATLLVLNKYFGKV